MREQEMNFHAERTRLSIALDQARTALSGLYSDPSASVFIDTESDPGSYADAIAHTPHLACPK